VVVAVAVPPVAAAPAPVVGAVAPAASRAAPRVIIDTDLSRWWDDVTAIGLANVLHARGRIRLIGVVSDVPNPLAVAAIDAIDTAYGHDRIPVGAVVGSTRGTFPHGYTDALVDRLPHSIADSRDAPGAVPLYRRLLARAPAHSVTIVSLGGFTNLAGLLRSRQGQGSPLTGKALVARKVKRLVAMDGVFPGGGPAFTNQKLDLAAASTVVSGGWPTPIAWVDGLGGINTLVGGTLCTTTKRAHPMRIAYEALFGCGPPEDGNWDAPTLLYAVGDRPGVFVELGRGGAAVVNAQGGLSWDADSPREHDVYVHVVDQPALNGRIDGLLTSTRDGSANPASAARSARSAKPALMVAIVSAR
jgi:hypothetical protein